LQSLRGLGTKGMSNFLEETMEILIANKKTPKDVLWCGDHKHWFPWEVFEALADFEYDPGFGCQEVYNGLLVVGDNWWLERGEYDGGEWWDFKTMRKKPESMMIPFQLKGWSMWEDIYG
jgi:hypothetical protein